MTIFVSVLIGLVVMAIVLALVAALTPITQARKRTQWIVTILCQGFGVLVGLGVWLFSTFPY